MSETGWHVAVGDGATCASLAWPACDHTALVMIIHDGVDRHEVEAVLRRRWSDLVMKEFEQEAPIVAMSSGDAADLGQRRRGVEPLRIVIMPQHYQQVASTALDPMAVLV
jgi:hypothetical protein